MTESMKSGTYTKKEMCDLLRITTRTLDEGWRAGRYPKPLNYRRANKSRNKVLWNRVEVDVWLEERGMLPSPMAIPQQIKQEIEMLKRLERQIYTLLSRLNLKGFQFDVPCIPVPQQREVVR